MGDEFTVPSGSVINEPQIRATKAPHYWLANLICAINSICRIVCHCEPALTDFLCGVTNCAQCSLASLYCPIWPHVVQLNLLASKVRRLSELPTDREASDKGCAMAI